jgi:hypothetical protein
MLNVGCTRNKPAPWPELATISALPDRGKTPWVVIVFETVPSPSAAILHKPQPQKKYGRTEYKSPNEFNRPKAVDLRSDEVNQPIAFKVIWRY